MPGHELKKELYGDLMYVYKTLYKKIRYNKANYANLSDEDVDNLEALKEGTEDLFGLIDIYVEE